VSSEGKDVLRRSLDNIILRSTITDKGKPGVNVSNQYREEFYFDHAGVKYKLVHNTNLMTVTISPASL